MVCSECQSGYRDLVLLTKDFVTDFGRLLEFADEMGWELFPELDAILVHFGPGCPMQSTTELVNAIRVFVHEDALANLRATWVRGGISPTEQIQRLIHAEPLAKLIYSDSTPLYEILRENRLETFFQPIFRAEKLEHWGYECLIRGRGTENELLSPAQLLDWVRQENLLFMFDRLCRETHLRNAARHLAGTDCCVLMNFIPTSIYKPEYCLKSTVETAQTCGLRPEQIIFEVVETESVKEMSHLRRILDVYRRGHFRVALDDVGSGFAGLSLLAELDPDLIKIDRGLIIRAAESTLHLDVCRALVKLGADRGKLVLAEGVETPEHYSLMRELGVDLVQGYLFGKPNPTPIDVSVYPTGG
jgi:EAL domain-containing protein (putative c-di-GMP-specific phosphodiesterase class I)